MISRHDRLSHSARYPVPSLAVLALIAGLAAGGGGLIAQQAREPAAASDQQPASDRQWLVTFEGERIETRGPWRVAGRRVLFTNQRGTLSSMRLSQIDLESSERLSQALPEGDQPQAALQAPPAAALVLETKDVSRWTGSPAAASPEAMDSEAASSEAAGETASASDQGPRDQTPRAQEVATDTTSAKSSAPVITATPVTVVSWRDLGNYEEGIKIYGTLKNVGEVTAMRVKVTVKVLDEAGNQLEQQQVKPRQDQIAAGDTSNFRAFFPDLSIYGSAEFEVSADR